MDSRSHLDPSVIDSTSELLEGLDLIERNHNRKNMDNMETDMVLEVPDTPDRLAVMRMEVDVEKGASPSFPMVPARKTYYRRQSDLGRSGNEGSSANAIDTERLFRKARMASLISKSLETRPFPHTYRTRPQPQQDSISFGCPPSPHDQGGSVKSGEVVDACMKIPLNISCPTRFRNDRWKLGNDLHGEGDTYLNDELMSVGSFPTEAIRRTQSGIQNSFELSTGVCEAEKATTCDGANVGLKGKGKGIVLISDSKPKNEQALSRPLQRDGPPRKNERRRLVRNGCISPLNVKGKILDIDREAGLSFGGRDKGKGIDLSCDSQTKSEQAPPLMFDVPRRSTGHRSLVRNGRISPANIANGKEDGIDKMANKEHSDGISPWQLHTVSSDSGGSWNDKTKGKEVVDETVQANGRDAKSRLSSRPCPVPDKDATAIGDVSGDAKSTKAGWRSTCNPTGKVSLLSSNETANVSRRSEDVGLFSNQSCVSSAINTVQVVVPCSFPHGPKPSPVQASSNIISESKPENRRRRGAQRLSKGKRKCSSACTHLGECSSSTFDLSQGSNSRTFGQPSNAKSTRTRESQRCSIALEPIIDVDELPSPELRCSNPRDDCGESDFSSARALQVESDEILARQLQEQFFNESPGHGGAEEIDASLAWTLQEEDSQGASFSGGRHQSYPRDTSIAHLYRHYPRQTSQNSSVRSTNHARIPSSARMARLRRNLNRREMDIEMRLNFLEALEAAFDNNDTAMSNHILQLQRDFNENDYEMLLALDDDNHHHVGASLHQINSLPESVIETDNFEEACAVCLETPSTGDTIRHLPCLHKFHKECIDTWLRRKTLCPICKSGIT